VSQKQSQSWSDRGQTQNASLSPPLVPDATSPYKAPPEPDAKEPAAKQPAPAAAPPADLGQPYYSEAQATLGAADRTTERFAQPEDAAVLDRPSEQPGLGEGEPGRDLGEGFATPEGTVRSGMAVIDASGHPIGFVTAIEGEKMRISSTDPHDDGVAFLPVSLIDGVDGDRVLLASRGDASFGMSE